LESGSNPHIRLSSDVEIEVAGNRLVLEEGSSIAENVIRYCRIQPEFFEKVIRFLRKANDVDSKGRSLMHMLVLAADDRSIIRKPLSLEQQDSRQRKVAEFLEKSLLKTDSIKLIQYYNFALLYHSGASVNISDSTGRAPLITYVDWLKSLPSHEAEANFENLVENAFGRAMQLFGQTDYLDDPDRLSTLIVGLEALIEVRGKFPRDKPSMGSLISSLGILKSEQINRYRLREPPAPFFEKDYGIGSYPFTDMFSDRLSENVNDTIQKSKIKRNGAFRPIDLKEFKQKGLEINKVGKDGFTLLFCSYLNRSNDWFESLLENGADPSLKLTGDLERSLNVHIRDSMGLVFCPERGESVLMAISINPSMRSLYFRTGMRYWKSWNDRDDLQRNVLHRMLYHRVPKSQDGIVMQLVDAGVDLNAQSIGGSTPCHLAVYRNASFIPSLLARGADPAIRDLQGRTVFDLLQLSIDEKWTYHEESVSALQKISVSPR
jgi:ankyrin repeat protein